jgi:hypothetical protein
MKEIDEMKKSGKRCDCLGCKESRELSRIIKKYKMVEKDQDFLDELYCKLLMESEENSVNKMRLSGDWPEAEFMLKAALKKIKENKKEKVK